MNCLHIEAFLIANASGGIIWAAAFGIGGYFFGKLLLQLHHVPWSTLCRADWVRNDPVFYTRGWLLRHYDPVSPGAARGHAAASEHQGVSLMGPGQEGAIAGRPAHDHRMNSPSSGTHTAHYSPVMIAPLSINSSHADCALFFFLTSRGHWHCGGRNFTPRIPSRLSPRFAARAALASPPREKEPSVYLIYQCPL